MRKQLQRVTINMSVDKELHKRMQLQKKMFGINWSQIMEQSLVPIVSLFDKAIKEVERSGETDITKIRMLFQKVLLELTGKAYEAHQVIDKDLDRLEANRKKK